MEIYDMIRMQWVDENSDRGKQILISGIFSIEEKLANAKIFSKGVCYILLSPGKLYDTSKDIVVDAVSVGLDVTQEVTQKTKTA